MKGELLQIRISETDKRKLQELAAGQQMSMSEYIISLLRAEEVRRENRVMKLYTADREAGNFIEEVASIEEGRQKIAEYEAKDKADGTYEANFYEIEDENHMKVD